MRPGRRRAVVRDGRARQPRRVVLLYLSLPEQRAGLRLERIEPARLIAERQRVFRSNPGRHDRRANRPVGLEGPLDATRSGPQGMDHAAGAPDEHLAVDDGRLRKRRHVAVESERPSQLQSPHLVDAQASRVSGLKTSVCRARAPPVPGHFGGSTSFTLRSPQNAEGGGAAGEPARPR